LVRDERENRERGEKQRFSFFNPLQDKTPLSNNSR
jgi:hypothetical protein